jgi:hypothetical protein
MLTIWRCQNESGESQEREYPLGELTVLLKDPLKATALVTVNQRASLTSRRSSVSPPPTYSASLQ